MDFELLVAQSIVNFFFGDLKFLVFVADQIRHGIQWRPLPKIHCKSQLPVKRPPVYKFCPIANNSIKYIFSIFAVGRCILNVVFEIDKQIKGKKIIEDMHGGSSVMSNIQSSH